MIRRYKKNSFSHPTSTIKSSDLAFTPYTIHRYVQIKQKPYNSEKEKHIVEPYPICTHCGKKILHISEAFVSNEGTYLHFDCAKEIAKEALFLKEDEKISYIGNGKFAAIKITTSSSNNNFSKDNKDYRNNRDFRDVRETRDSREFFRAFEFKINREFQIETKEAFDKLYKTVEDAKK